MISIQQLHNYSVEKKKAIIVNNGKLKGLVQNDITNLDYLNQLQKNYKHFEGC